MLSSSTFVHSSTFVNHGLVFKDRTYVQNVLVTGVLTNRFAHLLRARLCTRGTRGVRAAKPLAQRISTHE